MTRAPQGERATAMPAACRDPAPAVTGPAASSDPDPGTATPATSRAPGPAGRAPARDALPHWLSRAALTLLLAALALAGNRLHLSLFFGVEVLLGSVAVLLATVWLGTWAGILAAAVGGAYTIVLWGHPYALITLVGEAAAVGWQRDRARRRGRPDAPLAVSVAIYWTLLGVPLVLLFYRLGLGLAWPQVLLVALKQPLNGIFNAALAGLALIAVETLRHRQSRVPVEQVLFSALLAGVLVPSLTLTVWENRNLKDRLEGDASAPLVLFGRLAANHLEISPNRAMQSEGHGPGLQAELAGLQRPLREALPAGAEPTLRLDSRSDARAAAGDTGSVADGYTLEPTRTPGLSLLLPKSGHGSRISQWRRARYRIETPDIAGLPGYVLYLDFNAAPLIDALQGTVSRLLALLLGLTLAGVLIAQRLSRWLVRPLQRLVETSRALPAAIREGRPWPEPIRGLYAETEQLADAVGEMASSLASSFRALESEKDEQAHARALVALQAEALTWLVGGEDDESAYADRLCRRVQELVPDHLCSLARPGPDGTLQLLAAPALSPAAIEGVNRLLARPGGLCCYNEAMRTGAPAHIPDFGADPRCEALPAQARARLRAGWGQPVYGSDRTVQGVLSLGLPTPGLPSPFARDLLATAAAAMGVALESIRLRRRHEVMIEAISQSGTGIVIERMSGGKSALTFVNRGFEELTGYRADEVLGRSTRFLQGEDRDQPGREAMRAAIAAGQPCRTLIRNYRKDGSRIWVSVNLSPMRDGQGQVTHYIGIQQDMTETVEALERLRESEASLREAQTIAHVGSWELDVASGNMVWSDEGYRLLGYAPGAVPASRAAFLAAVPAAEHAACDAAFAAALKGPEGHYRLEHGVLGPDGVPRILLAEGRVTLDAQGRPLRMVGTSLDVTRQRATEDALRAEQERYRLVVDNVEDIIVRTDAEGRFEFVSPSYCATFGLTESELVGQINLPQVHPDDQAATAQAVATLFDPPHSCRIEHRALTVAGWRWFQWSDRALLDGAGRVVGVVAVGRDITERKATELALAAERQRLANVIAGTRVGTWEWEVQSGATVFNERWAEIVGYRLEELAPTSIETWMGLAHPEDLQTSNALLQRHFRGELDTYECELRIRHRDGRWVWVLDQGRVVSRGAQGEPLLMSGIHQDIDQRKRAELAVAQRESILSELLALAAELVKVSDAGIDQAIDDTLERLGHFSRADRSYLFLMDEVQGTLGNTHEWTAQGVAPAIDQCQDLSEADLPALATRLRAHEPTAIDAVADLGADWAAERAIFESQDIRSLLIVPLVLGDSLLGLVGLDAVREPRIWSAVEVRFLQTFASLVAGALDRARTTVALRTSHERLRESEARLSAVFDNAPLGMALMGPDGRVTLANRALGAFLGCEPTLIEGMPVYGMSPRQERRRDRAIVADLMAGRLESYRAIKRYRRMDGREVLGDLRVAMLPGRPGEPPIPLGMVEDVTELHIANEQRQALEDALGRYTAQLEELVDVVNLPLTPQDQAAALLRLGCRSLGMAAAILGELDSGHRVLVAVREDNPEGRLPSLGRQVLEALLACQGQPRVLGSELLPGATLAAGFASCIGLAFECPRPDGPPDTLILTLWSADPTQALGGPERQILRLIAQRVAAVRHEERMQRDLVQAKERETIGHLASGVAHDFNNLLGVIDANLYYLEAGLSRDDADPEIAQVLEETQSALGQAKVVTSGMLSLSRAGGVPFEAVDLERTVAELARILAQVLPPTIRLRIEVSAGLKAHSNGAFLQAALLNLALNARDAMPNGGDLTIAAAPARLDGTERLAVGTLPAGERVELCVSDTGHGMGPEILAHIFDPLFSTKAKQRGHGLGLFMVQEFVARSGAGLAVTSQPGAGTRFRLLLESAADAPPAAPALPQPPQVRGLRVLVVDDDPRVRDAVGRLLALEGIDLATAENGAEALALLERDAGLDLVLSDIAMPVLDGIGLYRALSRTRPWLPVILMTGQDSTLSFADDLPHPAVVLHKPVDPQALHKAIRAEIGGLARPVS